jgi:hypothetical protein
VATLTRLSVGGMIVVASTTLLADSRAGERGGVLSWSLLMAGSVANVAVAEPTATGPVIAAWPSFALIAAYELLIRQVRRSAAPSGTAQPRKACPQYLPWEAPSAPGSGSLPAPAEVAVPPVVSA